MLGLVLRRGRRLGSSNPLAESSPTLVLSQTPEKSRSTDLEKALFPVEAGSQHAVMTDEPFRRVGRYLLIEPLGAGSQAVVWRALRFQPPVTEVALKVIRLSGRVDSRHVARLRHEAERGQRLQSEGMLPTLEYGIADGFAFLAMPVVSGCSLRDLIAQRREDPLLEPGRVHRLAGASWPDYWEAILRGLARVCRTVQDAHDAHVAHRDIKPANLLVDWDEPERIYLADFGMGRDLDIATPAQLTADASGTPLYMAPEKIQGGAFDERKCDVYSLGITLYETVTLQRPYRIPAGLTGVLLMAYLARQRPLRPRQANRRVPESLERIILQAMESDPKRRYGTALALAADLERFLESGEHRRRTWLSSARAVSRDPK